MLDERIYESYIGILKEEMVPAMGCTEPIALAYGAARAREVLGKEPEHITAKCSGNIIKNVRCVIIPNSDGLTGIEAGVVLGAVAGAPSLNMEVLSKVNDSGETISCVGQIGKEGMKETDKEILRIMPESV